MKAPPAVICVFLACLGAVALGQGIDTPSDAHGGADSAQRDVVVTPTGGPQVQSPANDRSDDPTDPSRWPDWETASDVATTFGAFFGLVGLLALIKNVMDTGKAARAAKVSADAANESILVAKRALLSERPYLVIESATLISVKDEPLQMEFTLKNWGKGPAILSNIRAELLVREAHTKARPVMPEWLPDPPYSECLPIYPLPFTVLAPGKTGTFKTNPRGSGSDRDSVATGKRQPVGFGRIDYRDIFGGEWETGFLWLYWVGNMNAYGREWAFDKVSTGPKDWNYTLGPRDPEGGGGQPWSCAYKKREDRDP